MFKYFIIIIVLCISKFIKISEHKKINILFLGSSIVKGEYGVNWISQLNNNNNKLNFINAGINGAQVPTLIKLLLSNNNNIPTPNMCIIMIGSNDASTYITKKPKSRMYISNPNIFKKEYEILINIIKNKYGNIPIGICAIKPISENINSELNQIIIEYNQVLMNIVKKTKQTTFINIYASLLNEIRIKRNIIAIDNIQYILSRWRHRTARYLKPFISMNTIGNIFGYHLFCDGIHFNERSATIVKNMIQTYIDSIYNFTHIKCTKV